MQDKRPGWETFFKYLFLKTVCGCFQTTLWQLYSCVVWFPLKDTKGFCRLLEAVQKWQSWLNWSKVLLTPRSLYSVSSLLTSQSWAFLCLLQVKPGKEILENKPHSPEQKYFIIKDYARRFTKIIQCMLVGLAQRFRLLKGLQTDLILSMCLRALLKWVPSLTFWNVISHIVRFGSVNQSLFEYLYLICLWCFWITSVTRSENVHELERESSHLLNIALSSYITNQCSPHLHLVILLNLFPQGLIFIFTFLCYLKGKILTSLILGCISPIYIHTQRKWLCENHWFYWVLKVCVKEKMEY